MIPASVDRQARWVLDTIGARQLGFGDDVPYNEQAWEQVERGELPGGDDIAAAFFHLSRAEELDSQRDHHGRFPVSGSALDPLDPPLERLRRSLGLEPPRWHGARFAVALSHDIDVPWRWTPTGMRGAAARLKGHAVTGRARRALREARALSAVPLHKLRGTDPNWSFERILRIEQTREAASTFFVMAGHSHPADGPAPEAYERLRPRLVETLCSAGAEIALHGSYAAAEQPELLAEEKRRLEALAGPVLGQRYHYLRVSPESNLTTLEELGFQYDASLAFADAPGFRSGIAHPFRPWDWHRDRPLRLIEVPLAVMDVTLAEDRYLGLSPSEAERRLLTLVDWAAAHGGGFSVLWHAERFDSATAGGWDRLYLQFIKAVRARGGVCLSIGALAREAEAWLA